jgi:hypothetical protein
LGRRGPTSGAVELNVWALQVRFSGKEHEYLIWFVQEAWLCPYSDMALLQVTPGNAEADRALANRELQHLCLDMEVPSVGDKITAYGYTQSHATIELRNGVTHYQFDDKPRVSLGHVTNVFPERRDFLLPFPVFETDTLFDGGMSGGPIINERGAICGIVCSGLKTADDEGHISYACSVWPIMGTSIAAGSSCPPGTMVAFYKLFEEGKLQALNLGRVSVSSDPLSVSYQPAR